MSVRVAFVDDTKQRKCVRDGLGELIALAGVSFEAKRLRSFSEAVNAETDRLGIPRHVELKWSTDSKADWFRETGHTDLLTPLRKRVLELAQEHEARAVVVMWDKSLKTGLRSKPPETNVLEWLWERLSMPLLNSSDIGMIVADTPGGSHKDEDKWIGETLTLTESGTEYVNASAIVLPILTAPSHHHRHIQLADLIVGSVTSAVAGSKYGLDIMSYVLPLLQRNALGYIGGTGLKVYPDALINLYHWVLREDVFTKTSKSKKNREIRIPSAKYGRLVNGDGLNG